jgi:LPS sulfotransferase NodH
MTGKNHGVEEDRTMNISTRLKVSEYFAPDDEHSAKRRGIGLKLPRAEHRLVIHFTPRSGSSWLSSLLESAGYLGTGLELFNPNFMANIARHFGARSLGEYIDLAHHFSARKGVLSFEVTSHQILAVFKDPGDFFNVFEGSSSFWLIREDIVAQAVSLAKMVRLNIAHATSADAETRSKAESNFDYDGAEIKKWLNHILVAERHTESFLRDHRISSLRFSYEQITKLSPIQVLETITAWSRLPAPPMNMEIATHHEKIGTSKNIEYAEHFREENSEFLNSVNEERNTWLGSLCCV